MGLLTGRLARRALPVLALAGLGWSARAAAQAPASGERAIKAAYLYNFTKYVEWPGAAFGDAGAPFVVCVAADAAFVQEVRAFFGQEQVRGRRIEILQPGATDDLKGCHMAYLGRSAAAPKRVGALRQAPVLTVGEGQAFLAEGGLVAFVVEKDRVRFDISKRGADAAGLTVSSKLLRVARHVDGQGAP